MEVLLIIISALFSLIASLWEIRRIIMNRTMGISSLVGFMFIFIYGIVPLVTILSYFLSEISISTNYYQYDYTSSGLLQTIIWQGFGIFSYIVVRFITKQNHFNKESYQPNDCAILEATTLVSLLIGIMSLYLWSKAYGGIFNLIEIASIVRSSMSTVYNSLAFFKHPARIVLIASYSSLILLKQGYKRILNSVVFALSFVYSLLFLLANDGRLSLALYFVVLIFILFDVMVERNFSRKKMRMLCIIAIAGFTFLMNADNITYYVAHGQLRPSATTSSLDFFVNECAYILISGQKAVEHMTTFNLLIIDDILCGLQAWLPTSLKVFPAVNIWDYNTTLATNGFNGQFPCDFISTSLYDLSFIGPLVFSVFWGGVLKKAEKIRQSKSLFSTLCFYSLFSCFFRLVSYCQLYDLVLGIFSITIFAIVYWIIKCVFSKAV